MTHRMALLLTVLVSACGISKSTHKKTLDALATCNNDLETTKKGKAEAEGKLAKLEGELKSVSQGDSEKQARIAALLSSAKDAESELLQLRTQREQADKRLAAFLELKKRFQALVDTGKLEVAFRSGQMVIKLPSGVLFPSGQADLTKAGKTGLEEVLGILLAHKDRRFMIAGHTDNVPVKSRKFPNNWSLSTARAVSVLEFMIEQGFDPKNLAAGGYGEFDPVAPNDSEDNKQKNRRIEIVLVPDLSELPNLGVE